MLRPCTDIAAAGQQIALHSATHQYSKIYASTDAFWQDIRTLRQALEPYVDVAAIDWLRFPGGSPNTVSHRYGGNGIMKALKAQAVAARTYALHRGKTTTHPDGSTTTPGTQISTDQGTGESKAETETETQETGDKQKDEKKGQIDLDQELGEDRSKLTWDGVDAEAGKDQEEKAKYNGYTIQESKPSADGNSKELTLKKTSEPETKEMSAEDVAKLLDDTEGGVEKKTADEGKTT